MDKKKVPGSSAREAALRALVRVEEDGAYLNLALPTLLQNLPAEERSLARQLAVGTIQRLNTLDWSINLFSRRSIDTFTTRIRNLLRLSAYQILYLDRIPDYAVVNEAVGLARRFGHRGVAGLVNALLRRLSDETTVLPWPDSDQDPLEYLSLKHSQPQWLVARVLENFGFNEAENWCLANNRKPAVSIRPNLLQNNPEELTRKLHNEGFGVIQSPRVPGMLCLNSGSNLAATASFREGLFTIQGESSGLIAPLLAPQSGETVVDLCSAPGGKTTHIAELMHDRGLIYAVDLRRNRLQLVEKAARRLRLQSIKPLLADGRSIGRYNLPAPDAILVDAPCSGLGVIRRLPEIKWRRTEKDLKELQKLQLEMLSAAAGILPVGGRLLYSVCTTEPEETVQLVEQFGRSHGEFLHEPLQLHLPPALREGQSESGPVYIWPHRHDLDGFFIASWRKKTN